MQYLVMRVYSLVKQEYYRQGLWIMVSYCFWLEVDVGAMPVSIPEPDALVLYGVLKREHYDMCVQRRQILRSAGPNAEYWVLCEDKDSALQRAQDRDAESGDADRVFFMVTLYPSGFQHFLVSGILHWHLGNWLFRGDIPFQVSHYDGLFLLDVAWYLDVTFVVSPQPQYVDAPLCSSSV